MPCWHMYPGMNKRLKILYIDYLYKLNQLHSENFEYKLRIPFLWNKEVESDNYIYHSYMFYHLNIQFSYRNILHIHLSHLSMAYFQYIRMYHLHCNLHKSV